MSFPISVRWEALAKTMVALVLVAGLFVTGAGTAQARGGGADDNPTGHERHHKGEHEKNHYRGEHGKNHR